MKLNKELLLNEDYISEILFSKEKYVSRIMKTRRNIKKKEFEDCKKIVELVLN